jgi:hypothetical protein
MTCPGCGFVAHEDYWWFPDMRTDKCALCGNKFDDGITVLKIKEGWVHPECAEEQGR